MKNHNHPSGNKKGNDRIACREDEILPYEKWLVAFKNDFSTRLSEGIFLRQFYAPTFYEAYDVVATYAESFHVHILWFLEKRECDISHIGEYTELESLCTYCDNIFNHQDPIPCPNEKCSAKFCSRNCFKDHIAYKHK